MRLVTATAAAAAATAAAANGRSKRSTAVPPWRHVHAQEHQAAPCIQLREAEAEAVGAEHTAPFVWQRGHAVLGARQQLEFTPPQWRCDQIPGGIGDRGEDGSLLISGVRSIFGIDDEAILCDGHPPPRPQDAHATRSESRHQADTSSSPPPPPPLPTPPTPRTQPMWEAALQDAAAGNVRVRKCRAKQCGVIPGDTFLARVACFRLAGDELLKNTAHRQTLKQAFKAACATILTEGGADPSGCMAAIDRLESFIVAEYERDGGERLLKEMVARGIPEISVYDLALEFFLFDCFDVMDNPPQVVAAACNNTWIPLSTS